MTVCDDVRALVLAGSPLDDAAAAHLMGCSRCRAEEGLARRLGPALAAYGAVEPPAGLVERALAAAGPALARNARVAGEPAWSTLARAVGVALVPLPLLVYLDAQLVRGAYALLRRVLPDALSFYLVLNYTAVLALCLTLTYAAVPLLAERLGRRPPEEGYA